MLSIYWATKPGALLAPPPQSQIGGDPLTPQFWIQSVMKFSLSIHLVKSVILGRSYLSLICFGLWKLDHLNSQSAKVKVWAYDTKGQGAVWARFASKP